MTTKTLTVELPEGLYTRFIETVTERGGRWRSPRCYETETGAIEGAVYAALIIFLQDLTEESAESPECRDYMHEKYQELDEGLITIIENLIKEAEGDSTRPQASNHSLNEPN